MMNRDVHIRDAQDDDDVRRRRNGDGDAEGDLGAASIDPALLDALVDGELSDVRRRDLLLALEGSPDGWRRCALAFLEAQTWRQACRSIFDQTQPIAGRTAGLFGDDTAAPSCEAITAAPTSGGRRRGVAGPVWRIAAGVALLLAGFAAGWGAQSVALDGGDNGGAIVHPAAAPGQDGAGDRDRRAEAPSHIAAAMPGDDLVHPIGFVDLHTGEASDGAIRIPILAGRGADQRLLAANQLAIDDELRGRLERQGYRLEHNRRLLAVKLDDGRDVVIPVEQLQWVYVGHRAH